MNLADMQALIAVVETGSLAHAAIKLNLTQPAITRRIQRLEETLGAKLLDRDVKPARPTAEGEAAYAECVRVLNAADGLKSAVGRGPRDGRALRLGVSYGAADVVLPALVPPPEGAGSIAIESGGSIALERTLTERRLDAALVMRDTGHTPSSTAQKVTHLAVRVVAPREMGLPRRVALKDLRGQRWVLCPDGCGYRRALEQGLYSAAQPLDIAAAVWGFRQQARLVAAGAGLGLLPEVIIAEEAEASALHVLEISDFSAALDLWLIRASGLASSDRRLEAIAEALRQRLDAPLAKAS